MKLTTGQDELGAALASLRRPPSATSASGGSGGARGRGARRVAMGVVVCALGVAGALGWRAVRARADAAASAPSVPAPAVVVAPSRAGSVSCTGYVEEEEHARIAAAVTAPVLRVHVREGDVVQRGDRLVDLDATELEATIASARARASAAAARGTVAAFTRDESALSAERERNLVAVGAAPKATADDADARLRVLGAGVTAARADAYALSAEIAVLNARLALHHLAAPFAGVVVTRPASPGEVAVIGAPLMELAGALVVAADVPEARLGQVAVGATAEVRLDAFPEPLAATVIAFAPRVDKAKATGAVKLRITRLDVPLRVGMAARVRIDVLENGSHEKAKEPQ